MCCEKGCHRHVSNGSHYCQTHAPQKPQTCGCQTSHDKSPHTKHGDKGGEGNREDSDGCCCCHAHEEADNSRHFRQLLATLICAGIVIGIYFLVPLPPFAQIAMFLAVYVLAGGHVIVQALKSMIKGHVFDENFLMTLATICAFVIGEYPEALAVMVFYQIGEYFQGKAVRKSRESIASLMDIRPEKARVIRHQNEVETKPEDVHVGEIIVVRPGERLPLDGRVISGHSMLDTRALTGESVPHQVVPGDHVLSGSINTRAELRLEVTSVYAESTAARILALIEASAVHKSPTERFMTTFAKYYTPTIVILAILFGCFSPIFLDGSWQESLRRACVFLVISCPCALVVSIPLSYFAGIGAAARQGILFKGGDVLDTLYKVRTLVFDKTGTLTQGTFEVTKIYTAHDVLENEVLKTAAVAERGSNHPIALSILAAAQHHHIELNSGTGDLEEIAGLGVIWHSQMQTIYAGNLKLMDQFGIVCPEYHDAGTRVYIANDKQYLGCLIIADQIKAEASTVLKALKQRAMRQMVMLSGDHADIAQSVGQTLGFDKIYAELLPANKVEHIQALCQAQAPQERLAFVGDGLNDAPVLMCADVGIAMGGIGAEAAIEAADMVLMNDDLTKLPQAIDIAKQTRHIVLQNIVFALGIKLLFMLLGALGFMPIWLAVLADVGVLLLAVLNAMRLSTFFKP